MTLLKRYFWRSVLLPSLAIVAIIVGLDCLFSFIYELEFLRGGYQVMQALQFVLTTVPRRFHEYLPMAILLGTLIGLVQMLSNMEDPKSIGPAMAVALLTTLYGAMLATMIASPIADKLSLRMTEEARMQSLYIDALVAIQEGTNPRVIEQLLSSYLSPKERAKAGEPEPANG